MVAHVHSFSVVIRRSVRIGAAVKRSPIFLILMSLLQQQQCESVYVGMVDDGDRSIENVDSTVFDCK